MNEDSGRTMLAVARNAIAMRLGTGVLVDDSAPWLDEPGACFITLTSGGQLRGCIGSLEAYRPLRDDLKENAVAAAFRDPRFPSIGVRDLDHIRVEVSLLTPATPITFQDEADAVAQLRPGIDGVILAYGRNRGTFLPQVWEQLPVPRDFFRHLKMKAGLPPDFWDEGVLLFRYHVQKWKEDGPPEGSGS